MNSLQLAENFSTQFKVITSPDLSEPSQERERSSSTTSEMNNLKYSGISPPGSRQGRDTSPRPTKFRRISRACDFCHRRSIRCRPSEEDATRCQNCRDFAVRCTYNRPSKKRGTKSGNDKQNESGSSVEGEQYARVLLDLTNGVQGNGTFKVVDNSINPDRWRKLVLAHEEVIQELMKVYLEVVYPIFPLFHTPSLIRRTHKREYLSDQSFFANTMAICAISSARARDGALFSGRWGPDYFKNPPSESFFAAAKETIPKDLRTMRGLDWMRTCALMALYGIQVGRIEIMHQYLGVYQSLVAMDGLHDELNWPVSGIVETELRRRLFWSMYSLEVFSAIIWGGVIRCRESQCNVQYPSETDDEQISDSTGYLPKTFQPMHKSIDVDPWSWLHGWNFVTDLYRTLEYAMDDYQHRQAKSVSFLPRELFRRENPHKSGVLQKVMELYENLPAPFKETQHPQIGHGVKEDKLCFQAANITATLQLVRMVLSTSDGATVDQKCTIARDLLESFAKIPVFFLRAISSPLLYHLAGIGIILGSGIGWPLSDSSYMRVREVILEMANLLASLEAGFNEPSNVGASSRLQNQVCQIDKYMFDQRQAKFRAQSASAQPLSHHGTSNVPMMRNANIDPVLQATSATISSSKGALSGPGSIYQAMGATNKFDYSTPLRAGSVYISGRMNEAPVVAEGLSVFQIPHELLDGWPGRIENSTGAEGFGG